MSNFIFSVNAVLPIFLTMLLGVFFRRIGVISESFASMMNQFVFKIALPVLLFQDLCQVDFFAVWDTRYVCFCFFVTLTAICVIAAAARFFVKKELQAEFVQAGYRSSAAIIGIAFMQNIYGSSGMGSLMILATVPLYNAAAVAVLILLHPQQKKLDRKTLLATLKGVITNPIILGILAGVIWSAAGLGYPVILERTAANLAKVATPLGLLALGASFEWEKAIGHVRLTAVCASVKLVLLAAIFLPLAIYLGFRDQKLIGVLVMLGSATTVSSYVMVRNMGYEGVLTGSVVMVTTLFSSVTLTFWLYLLRSFGFV